MGGIGCEPKEVITYKHPTKPELVTVPENPGKELAGGTLNKHSQAGGP
jgi:predicted RNA binding protein YcfA (HicA-like mRNA interferase family)